MTITVFWEVTPCSPVSVSLGETCCLHLQERRVTSAWNLSLSHVKTDGQSVSQSWCRSPLGTHDQMLRTFRQLRLMSCAPSDEGSGLSFVIVFVRLLSIKFNIYNFIFIKNDIYIYNIHKVSVSPD
jgi:hypothetical protein